jgi:hypothetical protein
MIVWQLINDPEKRFVDLPGHYESRINRNRSTRITSANSKPSAARSSSNPPPEPTTDVSNDQANGSAGTARRRGHVDFRNSSGVSAGDAGEQRAQLSLLHFIEPIDSRPSASSLARNAVPSIW